MIETLLASKLISGLIAAGLVLIVAALGTAVFLHRSTLGYTARLTELVTGGETREARVQARNAGSALRPFLETLKGEPIAPVARPVLRDALLILLVLAPSFGFPLIGEGLLRTANGLDSVGMASALLTGMLVLLPASLLSAVLIAHLGVRSSRAVRSVCVTLLAQHVRSAVIRQRTEGAARTGQEVS